MDNLVNKYAVSFSHLLMVRAALLFANHVLNSNVTKQIVCLFRNKFNMPQHLISHSAENNTRNMASIIYIPHQEHQFRLQSRELYHFGNLGSDSILSKPTALQMRPLATHCLQNSYIHVEGGNRKRTFQRGQIKHCKIIVIITSNPSGI